MSASDNFDGLKVMVIDDSNTIRRSAEIFLGKTGAQVVLAEDGFDALAKIADHQPDLIFCDVMMPRLDGYQTCALIKKSPKFKTTPVVMLSSKDGLFDKAKGRMVGSDHYLTKPFTKDSLLQAVASFARRATPAAAAELPAPSQPAAPAMPAPAPVAAPAAAVPAVSAAPVAAMPAALDLAATLDLPDLPMMSDAPSNLPTVSADDMSLSPLTQPAVDLEQSLERALEQVSDSGPLPDDGLKSPSLELPAGDIPHPPVDLFEPSEKFTLSLV